MTIKSDRWIKKMALETGMISPFAAQQVREKYANLRREREDILPRARQLIAARAAYRPVVQEHYPAMFDQKTPEYQLLQNLIREQPALRLFPNLEVIVGDAIEGEKLRIAKIKAKRGSAAPSGSPADPPPRSPAPGAAPQAPRKAPKLPGAAGASPASPVTPPKPVPTGINPARYTELGGNHAALVKVIAESGILKYATKAAPND